MAEPDRRGHVPPARAQPRLAGPALVAAGAGRRWGVGVAIRLHRHPPRPGGKRPRAPDCPAHLRARRRHRPGLPQSDTSR